MSQPDKLKRRTQKERQGAGYNPTWVHHLLSYGHRAAHYLPAPLAERILSQDRKVRGVLRTLLMVIFYIAVFVPLYQVQGTEVIALVLLPVIVAGALMGVQAGVLAGVLSIPLNIMLVSLMGESGWETVIGRGGVGSFTAIPIGAGAGWLSDLFWRVQTQANELTLERHALREQIAERQRTERALRESQERLRSLTEAAFEGIAIHNQGQILDANQSLAVMFGYTPEEIHAMTLLDLMAPGSRQLLPTRYGEPYERIGLRKDGSTFSVEISTKHIPYQGTRMMVAVFRDITERKLMRAKEEAYLAQLEAERERSERLLLNILPAPVAERLKQEQGIIADSFADVAVLFADIVDFTIVSAEISPIALVNLLNEIFSAFDYLAARYGLEKIKTIGDSYMVVGGLPEPQAGHMEAVAHMALAMQEEISRFQRPDGSQFTMRIGIHAGPVVAGVIGTQKFIYDLWGDTVNTASRMEAYGVNGEIQVTAEVYARLCGAYRFEARGVIPVKGKGNLAVYLLRGHL